MKKGFTLSLLLWTLLYACAAQAFAQDAPVPWEAFVASVEEAVQSRTGDEVMYDMQGMHVESYADKRKDPAILLPRDVRLTLQNGSFDGMLIAGGEITLENVRAEAADHSAIVFQGHYSRQRDFVLTIAQDTHIVASGERAAGIYAEDIFAPDIFFSILNQGTIESMDSAGIAVTGDGLDYANAKVVVRNEGRVYGKTTGIFAGAISDKNEATLEVYNSGTITGDTWCGLSVMGLANRHISHTLVHNEQGGVIRSEAGYGIDMQLRDGRIAGRKVKGDAVLTNDGEISGAEGVLYVYLPFEGMVPLKLSGSGSWQGPAEGTEILIAARPWGGKGEGMEAEDFEKGVAPFLEGLGAEDLPEGIRIRAQGHAYGEEQSSPLSVEILSGVKTEE